ncbi:hypothetical protein GCM10007320_60070 [Pseudorhodoferax aquiterrae]|uniref:Nitroreductase domain-containing protein n=1 Tax=Pseudorhodoferax aquiterrae TaxID=747304 RepID=A0ABQ3GCG6_9BURK|nr:hypothetical protein GCM10007320_60070 [Pseudorhodoferax aquiterrae]
MHATRDPHAGGAVAPAQASQPVVRRTFVARAKGFVRHRTRLALDRIDLALLSMAARSQFMAKAYYFFASSAFAREQQAVVAGRLHHARRQASAGVAAVVMRRNIHRIEKGLCMVPQREVFALDYIDETLRAFGNLLTAGQLADQPLLRYAHDVLTRYFGVTVWPANARQPREFARLSTQMPADAPLPVRTLAVPAPYEQLPASDVGYAQFLALVQRRASVRSFESRPVARHLIDQAVAAAAQAPSACNRHSLRYVAAADGPIKEQLARLPMGTAGYADDIPVLLAVVGDLSAYPHERDRHLIYVDASLANMQFMLALETMGLASCAINWPEMEQRDARIAELLGLAVFERVVMLIAVGYPRASGLVPHSEKKSVHEMLSWK